MNATETPEVVHVIQGIQSMLDECAEDVMTLAEVHHDLKDTARWAIGRLRLLELDLNAHGPGLDEAHARLLGEVIERLERKLS